MSTETDISALYREFTDALTEVLAETAVGLARRGRLARARAALKKHPEYSEHAYFLAVEAAFKNWKVMQNVGRQDAFPAERSIPGQGATGNKSQFIADSLRTVVTFVLCRRSGSELRKTQCRIADGVSVVMSKLSSRSNSAALR